MEENDDGETALSLHVPLQLLHLRLDHQVNRFMGCDCHIDLLFQRLKALAALGHRPKSDDQSARAGGYGNLLVAVLPEQVRRQGRTLSPWAAERRAAGTAQPLAGIGIRFASAPAGGGASVILANG